MAESGIIWKGDLPKNLQKVDGVVRSAMVIAAQTSAPRIESWMKTNAPWTDRTGNARNGLRAEARAVNQDAQSIVLFGSVPYQVWLEVRWSGRYAIIGPAIEYWGPQVMSTVSKLVAARMRTI